MNNVSRDDGECTNYVKKRWTATGAQLNFKIPKSQNANNYSMAKLIANATRWIKINKWKSFHNCPWNMLVYLLMLLFHPLLGYKINLIKNVSTNRSVFILILLLRGFKFDVRNVEFFAKSMMKMKREWPCKVAALWKSLLGILESCWVKQKDENRGFLCLWSVNG